jgi:hypothetical protein
MVNIRTSKKRKSNYNRTRLSRRVKRGGAGEEEKKEDVGPFGQFSSRLVGFAQDLIGQKKNKNQK